jgi:hypothetical protein
VRSREVVAVSERYADRLVTKEQLKAARKRASGCELSTSRLDAYQAAVETANGAAYAVRLLAIDSGGIDPVIVGLSTYTAASNRLAQEQSGRQVAILRDLIGNPFRSVCLSPSWLTRTVSGLAQAIYDEGAFDRLPVLADALEDAGCAELTILEHLRGPGPHVRGCWVVDLILGKQ